MRDSIYVLLWKCNKFRWGMRVYMSGGTIADPCLLPPTMWSPIDKDAVPTSLDLQNARVAISTLEQELDQAQLRVERLTKELTIRRAWIAPIRRAPLDVLAIIFTQCSYDDWRTPLTISAVCRRFRDIVIATPQAWRVLKIRGDVDTEHMGSYFERSGKLSIHVGIQCLNINWQDYAYKIQCMSIPNFSDLLIGIQFPNLVCLRISRSNVGANLGLSKINDQQFPALNHLEAPRCGWEPISSGTTYGLPPIQKLSILAYPRNTNGLVELLQGCRSTLNSLEIQIFSDLELPSSVEIHLPRLRCLAFYPLVSRTISWPIHLKTPILTSYIQERGTTLGIEALLHQDLATVTDLRIYYIPPLTIFPCLRRMQLFKHKYPSLTMEVSNNAGRDCQHLELLEICLLQVANEDSSVEASISPEWSSHPGRLLKIHPDEKMDALPGMIPRSVRNCFVSAVSCFG